MMKYRMETDIQILQDMIAKDQEVLDIKSKILEDLIREADRMLDGIRMPDTFLLSEEVFMRFYYEPFNGPDTFRFNLYEWEDAGYQYLVTAKVMVSETDTYRFSVSCKRKKNGTIETMNTDHKWMSA